MDGSVLPRPLATRAFGGTVVEVWPHGTRVILADGKEVHGEPNNDDAYRCMAESLGYGPDTLKMCQHHDLAHVALAHFMGLSESPTLRRVAEGLGSTDLTNWEEAFVLSAVRFANAVGIDLTERFLRTSASSQRDPSVV
jgi:hypothetical protein